MAEISQLQIQEYKNAFDLFDKDKDGCLSREDMEGVCKSLGINKSSGEIRDMINECDPTKSGKISFTDFITVLSAKLRNTDGEEMMREAFQTLDPEKKGYIPAQDLVRDLVTLGDKLTQDEANAMLREIKCTPNGLFNYDDFLSALFMKAKTK